jgi:hypothetical protein
MKRPVFLATGGLLLAACSLLLLRPVDDDARRDDAAPAAPARVTASAGDAAAPAAKPEARAGEALPVRAAARPAAVAIVASPGADTPVRDALPALDAAARRGDAQAACRLGAELTACRAARMNLRFRMSPERLAAALAQQKLDEKTIERRVEETLRTQERIEQRLAHCEGVDLDAVAPPARYFMLAADAGHVPSMVQALHADHYPAAVLFRDPGLITQFRANALRYLHGALDAGDPAVLDALRNASHAPEYSVLAPLLPVAWRSAGFVAALRARVDEARGLHRPAPPPGAWAPEPPVPTAVEAAEAERVFARHFAGKLAPAAPGVPGMPGAPGAWQPVAPTSVERFRCDETAR